MYLKKGIFYKGAALIKEEQHVIKIKKMMVLTSAYFLKESSTRIVVDVTFTYFYLTFKLKFTDMLVIYSGFKEVINLYVNIILKKIRRFRCMAWL